MNERFVAVSTVTGSRKRGCCVTVVVWCVCTEYLVRTTELRELLMTGVLHAPL